MSTTLTAPVPTSAARATSLVPEQAALQLVPMSEVFRWRVLPLRATATTLEVATSNTANFELWDELRLATGLAIIPRHIDTEQLDGAIKDAFGLGGGTIEELLRNGLAGAPAEPTEQDDGEDQAQNASVIRLVQELLGEAVRQRASDLHLEPEEKGLSVRFRVDGVLRTEPVPAEIHQFRLAIVSRLKILAKLNIAEKRLPQDGRFELRVEGRAIDVRTSIIPMLHGEGVVLRLLDKNRSLGNMQKLAFPREIAEPFGRLIRRPHGIVLVTGPTGSGKTTTLYSAMAELRGPNLKIITVEDPVEYQLPGINQIQAHAKIGLTFSAGLRSILRHDPDVILIGEIRDQETAQSAIQASLTGHLVFSTLHTNDACTALTRLIEMGIEPYLVASTLEGVLAQRLVRALCPHCRRPVSSDSVELPVDFPQPRPKQLWEPRGCDDCRGTGYAGQVAIGELLVTDAGLRQLCIERANAGQLREYALARGLLTLRACGWKKVMEGVTSVEEVVRVVSDCDQ